MSDIPFNAIELCNLTSMRMAARRLTQLYDEALSPVGLRSTQFSILGSIGLRADDPPTVHELAKSLVLDRSGLSHALQPLVRDELVELRDHETDRRSKRVVLTEKGFQKIVEAWKCHCLAQERFESIIGKDRSDDLRRALRTIAQDDRLANLGD